MKYKPDFKILDKFTEEGFLRKMISPCGKLVLYNYSDKCTYEKKWNKHTLNSRGTVYEIESGEVVARAFPKFFNFGELAVSRQRNLIKQTEFTAFEKFDGSCGIVFYYGGKWNVNTRGSFTSNQSIKAEEMLQKYDTSKLNPELTYIVEIIYPENRIILDYGMDEKLVLLAGFYTRSGIELGDFELKSSSPFPKSPSVEFKSINEVIESQIKLGSTEEGFVVRFRDGYRVKFKSAEYMKIARIISNMSYLSFWKCMKNGKVDKDILEEIPEEFRETSDKIKEDLESLYIKVSQEINEEFEFCIKSIGGLSDLNQDRKNLGLFLKIGGNKLKHSGAIFLKLLNGDINKYIMKYIRPTGNRTI